MFQVLYLLYGFYYKDLLQLIYTKTLGYSYYCYFHFIGEETEIENGKTFLKT